MADRGAHGKIFGQEERRAGYSAVETLAVTRQVGWLFSPLPQALPSGIRARLGTFAHQAQTPLFTPHVTRLAGTAEYDPLANLPRSPGWAVAGSERLMLGMALQEGPAPNALCVPTYGCWRFRVGVVSTPMRAVSVYVKQVSNLTPRPQMVVRANAAIGLAADLVVTATSSTGWVKLTATVDATTAPGAFWVELWNRQRSYDVAYFGRLATGEAPPVEF